LRRKKFNLATFDDRISRLEKQLELLKEKVDKLEEIVFGW